MVEVMARCQQCGFEQAAEFELCPVCLGPPGWWCPGCRSWLPIRKCTVCTGAVIVLDEIRLGSFPRGTRAPVRFSVRNPGKKTLEFAVTSADSALSLLTRRLVVRPGEEAAVVGAVALTGQPGRRTYRVRFETPTPIETTLVLEVVPAEARLEFVPPEMAVRRAQPGDAVHRVFTLNNSGNVSVSATIAGSESWLGVTPARVEIAPGESAQIKVVARTRKTDHGLRTGYVRASSAGEELASLPVRIQLPEPVLEADPVDFGEIAPDRVVHEVVTLRNVGDVRVACVLSTDQPWLAVSPKKINLPPGGEKMVKLRALVAPDHAGALTASLRASHPGGELLRVPVSVVCRIPRPILGAIRKQSLGAIANDVPAIRRFRVANAGDGRLACTITADQPWIEVQTPELVATPGKKRWVEYLIRTPSMLPGEYKATISVRSVGGDAEVPVSVKVVPPRPELDVIDDLDLGTVWEAGPVGGHVSLRNSGVGQLVVRAEAADRRVTVPAEDLTLAPGPPARLAVSVNTEGLAGGSHEFEVHLTSNGGSETARLRFRLPIEQVEAPAQLDLDDLPAGETATVHIQLTNTGPDRVSLAVRSDEPWLRPAANKLGLAPGESASLPVRVVLQRGVFGRHVGVIRLEGRTVCHSISVSVTARRIELEVVPPLIALGRMRFGEERTFVFQVANRGELPAVIDDRHETGDLEVWINRKRIEPGQTATVVGRVRMKARLVGAKVRKTARLFGEETVVRLTAQVVRTRTAREVVIAVGAALTLPIVTGIGLALAALAVIFDFGFWSDRLSHALIGAGLIIVTSVIAWGFWKGKRTG